MVGVNMFGSSFFESVINTCSLKEDRLPLLLLLRRLLLLLLLCVVASLPCPLGTVTRLPLDVFLCLARQWRKNIYRAASTHSALDIGKMCKRRRLQSHCD